jgi:dTDP-4-amino-4,6-dideoxygalactose transaminase
MIRLVEAALGPEEVDAVAAVMRSGQLVQGARVEEFETLLAMRVGVRHAVAASSGTAALHLAVLALGLGPGDEVLVPDYTFPATANVVERSGARARLVDVEEVGFGIDPERAADAVGEKTRALMPVHQFGLAADMGPLRALARERGLSLIEDAACALGASWNGAPCGRLGDLACFSFHPRKVITTGEGGMLVTDDGALADALRVLRNHGITRGPAGLRFERAGLNYRMTEMQAAIGCVQLHSLEARLTRRAERAAEYTATLAEVADLELPTSPAGRVHSWQSYLVRLPRGMDRDAVAEALRSEGIETSVGAHALSAHPRYADREGPMPVSRDLYTRGLCLPLHDRMSAADTRTVAGALRRALAGQHSSRA